jgi:hypothetical protein
LVEQEFWYERWARRDRKLTRDPQLSTLDPEPCTLILNRSLGTSVEEDKSDKEHFENVSVREKTLTEQERMLTKDLATVKKDREKAVTARDAQIAALEAEKAELQQMTANAGKAVGEGNNANEVRLQMRLASLRC